MRRKLKCKPFTSDFCFWGVVSDTTPHVIPNDVTPQQPLSCHTRHPNKALPLSWPRSFRSANV